MGSVELLSREGEIAIAKRIEAGRETMIAGICESPLTSRAIVEWRDMLMGGQVLLRDVIDLDATYGGGPGSPNAAAGTPAINGSGKPQDNVSGKPQDNWPADDRPADKGTDDDKPTELTIGFTIPTASP